MTLSFKKTLSSAGTLLIRSPVIIVASLALYLFLRLLSYLGSVIAPSLTTNTLNITWVIFFGVAAIAGGGWFLCGMIGVAEATLHGAPHRLRAFVSAANNSWLKNAFALALILAVGALINFVAIHAAGNLVQVVGERIALIILFLLIMAGLLGVFSFLTLTSFYLVFKRGTVWESIRASIGTVRKHYLVVLSILLVFFIAVSIVGALVSGGLISGLIAELFDAIIILPLFVSVCSVLVRDAL